MKGYGTWTGTQALTTTAVKLQLTVPTRFQSALVYISGLWLFVNTIASSAAQLIVRLTRDSGGDECVAPAYTATISTGLTTATDGTVVIDYANQLILPVSSLYVCVATDTGTCTLTEAALTFSER